jgi:CBS domain-containing protein
MFSIYGETGRVFKGAMEDLWHIDAVRRASRARGIGVPGTRAQARVVTAAPPQQQGSVDHAHQQSIAAYVNAGQSEVPRHPLTRVREVMSTDVISVRADASVQVAWQMLAERGIGQAPVVDGKNVLVGLLTRADLLSPERLPHADANALAWRALLMQPVSSLMWTPVPAVAAETDIRRVARVLLETHLPGLPVTDEDGQVTGFVSRTDILRAVVNTPPLDLWS